MAAASPPKPPPTMTTRGNVNWHLPNQNNSEHDLINPHIEVGVTASAHPFMALPLPGRHSGGCGLRWRTRDLCGPGQPGFKAGLAELYALVWNQRSLAHLD